MSTTIDLLKIYNARNTILKNLKTIGYDTSPFEHTSFDNIRNFFHHKQSNLLNMTLHKSHNKDNPEDLRVFVHFHLTSNTIKSANIYDIIDIYKIQHDMKNEESIIVVTINDINQTMIKLLAQVLATDFVFLSVFSLDELQYSVLEHTYVPKHIPMDESQKSEISLKFNIRNDSEFPQISRFDPVAKTILLRPGQLCKIIRPSKTTIYDQNYYRLCC